jgi:hypothetical protein
VRSKVKWMRVGDSGPREFYQAHMQHIGASRINELEDMRG